MTHTAPGEAGVVVVAAAAVVAGKIKRMTSIQWAATHSEAASACNSNEQAGLLRVDWHGLHGRHPENSYEDIHERGGEVGIRTYARSH